MTSLPSVFISHGAPDLPIRDGEASRFLQQLGHSLPQPEAILVISAHWNTPYPIVSTALHPRTIHDFSGFSGLLYQLSYPAPGSPSLGKRVIELLTTAGIECQTNENRGLDHGAWTPLILAYPKADIPVTQLSIQYDSSPKEHFQIGQALRSLRDEGVLIISSGGATHNLWELDYIYDAPAPIWVQKFDHWLADALNRNDIETLINYRQLAPYAIENHPTEEHLLPLFVALGAAGKEAKTTQLHSSFTYGVLSMAAYAFA
ncbi:MAG TPA: class III extradiol ring-cleavage dioxygenase [Nostocaceae cyanobacterium]|nr:class III extradiol ring-cleavage dioxygenase [Nostocaceae cyanobacterium]